MDTIIAQDTLTVIADDAFDAVVGTNVLFAVEKNLKTNPGVRAVTMDMGRCNYINSSGISKLVELFNAIRKKGMTLTFINLQPNVKNIFKLTYMDKLFGV